MDVPVVSSDLPTTQVQRYRPQVKNWYTPTHLQIEPINGYCNARCIMCTIEDWKRKPRVMDEDTFRRILERFLPYRDHLRYLTLHCWGESLLDRNFPRKVKIASELGFHGIGLASNCQPLIDRTARELIDAGLNTLICSIDGFTKETHELVRRRTNFDKIRDNVLNFIRLRNESGRPVKVLIRFIRQQANEAEWDSYREYWNAQINPEYGDNVAKFDVHNVGGVLDGYSSKDVHTDVSFTGLICQDVFEKFLVFSDGSVGFCDADNDGFFDIGNVLETEPMDLYNSEIFNHYRTMMLAGKIAELEHCATCTIPRSRLFKTPTD